MYNVDVQYVHVITIHTIIKKLRTRRSIAQHPEHMMDIVGPCLSRHAQLRATTPLLGLVCGIARFPDGLHADFSIIVFRRAWVMTVRLAC